VLMHAPPWPFGSGCCNHVMFCASMTELRGTLFTLLSQAELSGIGMTGSAAINTQCVQVSTIMLMVGVCGSTFNCALLDKDRYVECASCCVPLSPKSLYPTQLCAFNYLATIGLLINSSPSLVIILQALQTEQ
jgi:hypothetical protein